MRAAAPLPFSARSTSRPSFSSRRAIRSRRGASSAHTRALIFAMPPASRLELDHERMPGRVAAIVVAGQEQLRGGGQRVAGLGNPDHGADGVVGAAEELAGRPLATGKDDRARAVNGA